LIAKLPKFKLVDIDYSNAVATLEYDPHKVWPGEKPEKYVERLDNELRNASRGTFGAMPLRTIPINKLKRIEIAVEGLDCKGCAFGAYQMIFRLPGVEVATVSFKSGKISALINPEKIDREKLQEVLKKGGVEVKKPTK
jgi:copper chaperone CopZ